MPNIITSCIVNPIKGEVKQQEMKACGIWGLWFSVF